MQSAISEGAVSEISVFLSGCAFTAGIQGAGKIDITNNIVYFCAISYKISIDKINGSR